ncbi:hypothetical protein Dtox_4235 [Desulfofarcimen acetoxidans DSM 771]|uniref:Uncharacterized protein n=1 Tax=Desulfofarcimen acetoxidans (strain ATCC 49208 / DSM 771 / KCTC 5769 / VKM B-1644 / 5575) TaxID=485916 RepID=C8VZF7_DESAS|nr:hypothetical protein [Desulfofarcimen acetoxidans]ACV64902.1 hypothetical protein Dtox_4235 [Desulfofarcimen acetoxidans DSM 771]
MRIISSDILKNERRKQTVEVDVPYISPSGEIRTVKKKIVNGEMEVFGLTRPMGEMLTTPTGLENIIQKSVIDLELGRESIPLLYSPIYRKVEDANFTQFVDVAPFTGVRVVFLEHMELEEVKFGTRKIGTKDTVPIITHATGLQWTEDMVLYDKTWEMAEANRAFGEAYNALLNHIHLYPVIEFAYAAKNKTAADTTGSTLLENYRNTIKAGLIHASQDKNTDTGSPRRPNILLAHSSRRWDIEECLQRMQIGGTIYPAISQIDTLIFYDGWSTVVGGKTHEYAGVSTTKAYLIEGQKYFRELVKHDLRVDASGADITRLVENAMVGRARRGVIASPANAVEELTLPA